MAARGNPLRKDWIWASSLLVPQPSTPFFPGRASVSAVVSAGFVERVRPLRRVEFDRMVEMGLFDNERVELLKGFIVRMSPQKSRHAGAVQYLTQFFVQALSSGRASVRVQLPLAAGDDSEPEPDIALVPAGAYRDHHPDSAYLVIEVAETSLAADREKAEVYAEGGIEEYWIVDTAHDLIEVRTDIVDGVYTRVTPYRRGQLITLRAFVDLTVLVSDVLG